MATAYLHLKKELTINTEQWIHLLRVCSPNLPIGGFSWSQGLEGAVGLNWIKNSHDLKNWLQDILSNSLAYNEIPIMGQVYRDTDESMAFYSNLLLSLKETSELKHESIQMGKSLHRLIRRLHSDMDASSEDYLYEINLSLLFKHFSLPIHTALNSYLWTMMENQVMAATRLLSLGQYDAQSVLMELQKTIENAVAFGLDLHQKQIGRSLPGLFIASSYHEQQYCRLFRS